MMKIFEDFRHDTHVLVIKRSPPPRLVKVLRDAWHPNLQDEKITKIESSFSADAQSDRWSTADLEHSSMLPSSPWGITAASGAVKHDPFPQIPSHDDLPLKKIDPTVIAAAFAQEPKISKKILINLINHKHFTKELISIHVRNTQTQEEFLQYGEPGPFLDDNVTIRFADPGAFDPQYHTPLNVIIDNRKSLIVFPINLQSVHQREMVIRFPEKAYAYSKRQAMRHACEGVQAEIFQGQVNDFGVLEDINPYNLRIRFKNKQDLNSGMPLFLKLYHKKRTYFFGEGRIVRSSKDGKELIVEPVHNHRPVLEPRKYPSFRVRIIPEPLIRFVHPLCGVEQQYKIEDISTSGFSITVPDKESLLIPGMIIPSLILQLPGMLNHLKCTVQVIYRRKQKKDLAKYGFYILDMSLHEQRLLYDAVSKVVDPNVNLTGKVNMDSLWELFFESGFIYPDKYGIISPYKEKLKDVYRKLYEEGQDIFSHLTYQDQGQIFGHLSMVKAYENSWIIHHLAARPLRGKRTGLKTLNHFVNYLDCLYRLPDSSKTMRYNFCYYRPENSFSDFYFGGVCKIFNNREICSMDLFGYMPMDVSPEEKPLPAGWHLEPFSNDDLMQMRNYYEGAGGGMMLDAYALEYRTVEHEKLLGSSTGHPLSIKAMYEKIGLWRDCKVYSIKHQQVFKAALIVDTSDLGVNMSELLNSIKVIIIDKDLPWPILQNTVSRLGKIYESEKIMILIYPYDYLKQQGVECKKRYNFWVLNTNLDSRSMDIIKKRAMTAKRKYITETFIKELEKYRLKNLFSKLEKK